MRTLALAFAAAMLAPCTELAVWPVDALVKVFPHDAPDANRSGSAAWLIARNGHASVQFAIRSAAAVKRMNVSVEIGGGLVCSVRRAGYVPVSSHPPATPADELLHPAPAFYPDPLIETFPYALPANRTDPIWITVFAPVSTPPGVHTGRVKFDAGEGSPVTQEFRVRVVDAAVPSIGTLQVTNWFNMSPQHLARFYKVTAYDDAYWQVLENIASVMAAHRQNVMLTPVRSLAMARVEEGRLAWDFSRLDRWVETLDRAGIRTIEGGHLLSRVSGYQTPLRVPSVFLEDGQIAERRLEPEDPRAEAYLDSFTSALYEHLKQRGWTARYVQHIHDEPHGDEKAHYNRFAKLIRRNLPGVPILDAVSLDQDLAFFAEVADIWVPVLGSFDKQMDKIREHSAKGGQSWFYTCIYPQGRHLNRFIDLPLLKTRLLHWLNFRHGLSGYLHWGGNYWSADPFTNVQPVINDGTTLLPAGDNAIVYPWPEKNSVLSSIRLEAMREGIEDYELLAALAKSNPEKAQSLAMEAIPQITGYVRDAAAFRRLQARLLGVVEGDR